MKAITPSKFETTGNDANESEKHVNDIRIYSTSVLHATEDGECVPVNTKEIAVSEGKEAAAHVVQAVVNTQRGELQFNSVRGIPYLETIFSHPDRLMEWETEMREAIESLPFVTSIESFETFVERMNAPHRDTQLKVSYKSSIRTTFDDGEEVDLNDGRTIRLHTFPIAPKSNWEFQTDPDSTDFEVVAEVGSFLLIHITCDRGTTISWDDSDKTAFSVVGETVTAVSHTYEKAGTFTVRLGSGIKRFTIEKNSIVKRVKRFSNTITDLSYAFKDNTGIIDVCEWADQITNVSYCYCGCTSLKGVHQGGDNYTIPRFTDSIDYCISTYEGCKNLWPIPHDEYWYTDEDGDGTREHRNVRRTDVTDAKYMPPRIHDLGFFYNCYYNASPGIRGLTLQSWGGDVIDFSDDRYATDLTIGTVAGNVQFSVGTNLSSQYMTYSIGTYTISGITSLNYKGIGLPSGTPQKGWWYKKLGKCFVHNGSAWLEIQSYTLTRIDSGMANPPIGGYYTDGTNTYVKYVSSHVEISLDNLTYNDATPNVTITQANVSNKRVKFSLGVRRIRCKTNPSVTSVNAYSSLITNIENMFYGITSLTNACAFSAAAKNVTNTFNGCTSLKSVGGFLGGAFWKNINELKGCFCGCSSLTCGTTDDSVIPSFPAVVSDVRQCYKGCASLKGITPSLANSVAKADECFRGCSLVGRNQQKINWGISLITASYCYQGCATLGHEKGADFVLPVWDDVAVRDASHCFDGCISLSCLLPLPPQDRILRLAGCFKGCANLRSIAVSQDTDGLYKYDKTLMPIAFRGTDTTAAFSDDEVTTPVATKNGYVEDCSTTIRSLYIQIWGGTRPNSDDAALEGNDYTEIFINTTDRTGQKIASVQLGLGLDVAGKLFYVTGLDAYPRAYGSYAGTLTNSFDSTQTFGTSSSTGVSTSVIRIVTRRADVEAGASPLAALTAFHLPSVARSYDFTFTNRGSSAPSTPSDGDYYISNGRTYLYKGEDIIEFPFAIAQKASGSIATSAQYNGDVGKYIISGGGTVLGDMGDMTYAIVNLNKVADTVTNMQNSFIYAEGLENTCAWPTALTHCASCYQFCTALLGLTEGSIPAWPSGVVSLFKCYYGCTSLLSMGMEKLHDFPAGATDAQYCYCNCTSITAMPGEWGGVENASHCYDGCTSLGSAQSGGELPYWGNVKFADYCYRNCSALDAVMPLWYSDSETPNIKLKSVECCFYGCTALNANQFFDNYVEAHPAALGGFTGRDIIDKDTGEIEIDVDLSDGDTIVRKTKEQQKGLHENCIANTNEEISKQFGSEWGGNFKFEPLRITVSTKKKVTGSLKFYVSINDEDLGTDATIDFIAGIKRVSAGSAQDSLTVGAILQDSDAQYDESAASGFNEKSDAEKLLELQRIVNANMSNLQNVLSCNATFQRLILDGDFKIYNVDVLGMDTSSRKNEQWTKSNFIFGTSTGSDGRKTNTKFPYVTSITDSKNGCCMIFLDKTFISQKRLESVSCNHLMIVGNYCFYNCKNLTIVDLPSVEYCGNYAFAKCINLKSVNLEKCVGLGTGIFDECKSLSTLRLNTIDVVRPYMLSKLASLEELEIATDGTECVINSEGISEIGRKVTTSLYFGSDVYFKVCALGYNKSYVQNIYCDIGINGFNKTKIFYEGGIEEVSDDLSLVTSSGERSSNGDYNVITSVSINGSSVTIDGKMTAKDSASAVSQNGDYYFGKDMYVGFCYIGEVNTLVGFKNLFVAVGSKAALTADGNYFIDTENGIVRLKSDSLNSIVSISQGTFVAKANISDLYSSSVQEGWYWECKNGGTVKEESCIMTDNGTLATIRGGMRERTFGATPEQPREQKGDWTNFRNPVVKNDSNRCFSAIDSTITFKNSEGEQVYLCWRSASSSTNIIKDITTFHFTPQTITDDNKNTSICVTQRGDVFAKGEWQKSRLGTHEIVADGTSFVNNTIPTTNVGGYVFLNGPAKTGTVVGSFAYRGMSFSNLLRKKTYLDVIGGSAESGWFFIPKFIKVMTKSNGWKYIDWDMMDVKGISTTSGNYTPTLSTDGDFSCYAKVCVKKERKTTTEVECKRQIRYSTWGDKGDFYVDENRTIHVWSKKQRNPTDSVALKTKLGEYKNKKDYTQAGDYYVYSSRIRCQGNTYEIGDVLAPSSSGDREGNFYETTGMACYRSESNVDTFVHGVMESKETVSDLVNAGHYLSNVPVSLIQVEENDRRYCEGFIQRGSEYTIIQNNNTRSNAISFKGFSLTRSGTSSDIGHYEVEGGTTRVTVGVGDVRTFNFAFADSPSESLYALTTEGKYVNLGGESIVKVNKGNANGNVILLKSPLNRVDSSLLVTSEGYYYVIDSDAIGTSIESNDVFQKVLDHFDEGCFYGIINGASSKINVDISLNGVYLYVTDDNNTAIKPLPNTVTLIKRIFAKVRRSGGQGWYKYMIDSKKGIGNNSKYIRIIDGSNNMMTAYQISKKNSASTFVTITDAQI